MRQKMKVRLISGSVPGLVLSVWLMGFCGVGLAQAEPGVNLLSNPGFEEDTDGDGLPDGWGCEADPGEPQRAINLDPTEKHRGNYSIRIQQQLDTSYSKLRGGVSQTKPHTAYVASCWVKVDPDDKVRTGPGAAGVRLFIGDENGKTLCETENTPATNGKWQRVVLRFNSGASQEICFMLYLHQGKGTVWFDDAELLEGAEPTATMAPAEPEAEGPPFPLVDFRPPFTSVEKTFYLIEKEPLHLELYYMGDAPVKDLKLVMEVPEGVAILKDYTSAGDPRGETVFRLDKKYTRYVLDVPADKILPSFNVWRPHTLILEADGPVEQGPLYWYLKAGEDQDKERQLTLITLPPLAALGKTPQRFQIVAGYAFPLKNAPEGESYDLLFERMLKLYLKSGIKGSLCYQIPPERMQHIVLPTPWTNNVQAGWDPGAGPRYMSSATLKEIQAVDENGERYPEPCPCPTYCFQENVMGKVAQAYFAHYSSSIAPGSLKETDFFEIDYEPNHRGWIDCFDERCLKAFAERSGMPRAGLTPQKILREQIQAWRDFRGWQNAQMIAQFVQAVRETNPRVQVGLVANPGDPWDPALMDPFVDFHHPMVYQRYPADFFNVIEEEIKRVKRPLGPWVAMGPMSSGLPGWLQTPPDLKLNILSTATAGGEGFYIFHGIDELCGLDLVKIRECNDTIARLEDYFSQGKRTDEVVRVEPAEKGGLAGSRAHQLGDHYLISVFNFTPKKETSLNVKLNPVAPGKYSLSDPLKEEYFRFPVNQSPAWTEKDLQAGFFLQVPAAEVRFILLKPYDDKNSDQLEEIIGGEPR